MSGKNHERQSQLKSEKSYVSEFSSEMLCNAVNLSSEVLCNTSKLPSVENYLLTNICAPKIIESSMDSKSEYSQEYDAQGVEKSKTASHPQGLETNSFSVLSSEVLFKVHEYVYSEEDIQQPDHLNENDKNNYMTKCKGYEEFERNSEQQKKQDKSVKDKVKHYYIEDFIQNYTGRISETERRKNNFQVEVKETRPFVTQERARRKESSYSSNQQKSLLSALSDVQHLSSCNKQNNQRFYEGEKNNVNAGEVQLLSCPKNSDLQLEIHLLPELSIICDDSFNEFSISDAKEIEDGCCHKIIKTKDMTMDISFRNGCLSSLKIDSIGARTLEVKASKTSIDTQHKISNHDVKVPKFHTRKGSIKKKIGLPGEEYTSNDQYSERNKTFRPNAIPDAYFNHKNSKREADSTDANNKLINTRHMNVTTSKEFNDTSRDLAPTISHSNTFSRLFHGFCKKSNSFSVSAASAIKTLKRKSSSRLVLDVFSNKTDTKKKGNANLIHSEQSSVEETNRSSKSLKIGQTTNELKHQHEIIQHESDRNHTLQSQNNVPSKPIRRNEQKNEPSARPIKLTLSHNKETCSTENQREYLVVSELPKKLLSSQKNVEDRCSFNMDSHYPFVISDRIPDENLKCSQTRETSMELTQDEQVGLTPTRDSLSFANQNKNRLNMKEMLEVPVKLHNADKLISVDSKNRSNDYIFQKSPHIQTDEVQRKNKRDCEKHRIEIMRNTSKFEKEELKNKDFSTNNNNTRDMFKWKLKLPLDNEDSSVPIRTNEKEVYVVSQDSNEASSEVPRGANSKNKTHSKPKKMHQNIILLDNEKMREVFGFDNTCSTPRMIKKSDLNFILGETNAKKIALIDSLQKHSKTESNNEKDKEHKESSKQSENFKGKNYLKNVTYDLNSLPVQQNEKHKNTLSSQNKGNIFKISPIYWSENKTVNTNKLENHESEITNKITEEPEPDKSMIRQAQDDINEDSVPDESMKYNDFQLQMYLTPKHRQHINAFHVQTAGVPDVARTMSNKHKENRNNPADSKTLSEIYKLWAMNHVNKKGMLQSQSLIEKSLREGSGESTVSDENNVEKCLKSEILLANTVQSDGLGNKEEDSKDDLKMVPENDLVKVSIVKIGSEDFIMFTQKNEQTMLKVYDLAKLIIKSEIGEIKQKEIVGTEFIMGHEPLVNHLVEMNTQENDLNKIIFPCETLDKSMLTTTECHSKENLKSYKENSIERDSISSLKVTKSTQTSNHFVSDETISVINLQSKKPSAFRLTKKAPVLDFLHNISDTFPSSDSSAHSLVSWPSSQAMQSNSGIRTGQNTSAAADKLIKTNEERKSITTQTATKSCSTDAIILDSSQSEQKKTSPNERLPSLISAGTTKKSKKWKEKECTKPVMTFLKKFSSLSGVSMNEFVFSPYTTMQMALHLDKHFTSQNMKFPEKSLFGDYIPLISSKNMYGGREVTQLFATREYNMIGKYGKKNTLESLPMPESRKNKLISSSTENILSSVLGSASRSFESCNFCGITSPHNNGQTFKQKNILGKFCKNPSVRSASRISGTKYQSKYNYKQDIVDYSDARNVLRNTSRQSNVAYLVAKILEQCTGLKIEPLECAIEESNMNKGTSFQSRQQTFYFRATFNNFPKPVENTDCQFDVEKQSIKSASDIEKSINTDNSNNDNFPAQQQFEVKQPVLNADIERKSSQEYKRMTSNDSDSVDTSSQIECSKFIKMSLDDGNFEQLVISERSPMKNETNEYKTESDTFKNVSPYTTMKMTRDTPTIVTNNNYVILIPRFVDKKVEKIVPTEHFITQNKLQRHQDQDFEKSKMKQFTDHDSTSVTHSTEDKSTSTASFTEACYQHVKHMKSEICRGFLCHNKWKTHRKNWYDKTHKQSNVTNKRRGKKPSYLKEMENVIVHENLSEIKSLKSKVKDYRKTLLEESGTMLHENLKIINSQSIPVEKSQTPVRISVSRLKLEEEKSFFSLRGSKSLNTLYDAKQYIDIETVRSATQLKESTSHFKLETLSSQISVGNGVSLTSQEKFFIKSVLKPKIYAKLREHLKTTSSWMNTSSQNHRYSISFQDIS